MEKLTNERGTWYEGISEDTDFALLDFTEVESSDENRQWALHTNVGSLTVVDRRTGFGYGIRDTETGYREAKAPETGGKFWLASGMVDVRDSGAKTMGEAIEFVKSRANTCVGI